MGHFVVCTMLFCFQLYSVVMVAATAHTFSGTMAPRLKRGMHVLANWFGPINVCNGRKNVSHVRWEMLLVNCTRLVNGSLHGHIVHV